MNVIIYPLAAYDAARGYIVMVGFYEVTYEDAPIGKAELRRNGLYGQISCRCKIPDSKLYRIIAAWAEGWLNLGIPVPDVDGFVLKKSVPMKRLGKDKLRFVLINAYHNPDELLYPKQLSPVTDVETAPKGENIGCEKPEEEVPADEKNVVLFSEDEPFEQLHEIMNARLEVREEGTYAVVEQEASDIQAEPNGTMVGSQDICVNGSGNNFVTDPV